MAAGSVASAALTSPPMNAQQTVGGASFDNSGWNVNVGAGASQSAATSKSTVDLSAMLKKPVVLIAIVVGLYYLSKHK